MSGSGKVVKTINEFVATQNGESEPAKVTIRLMPGDGTFFIEVPQFISDFIGRRSDTPSGFDHRKSRVEASKLDNVVSSFRAVNDLYRRAMKDSVRRKVLVVTFSANRPGEGRYSGSRLAGISFAPRPALAVTHEVQWAINDNLYHVHEHGGGELPQIAYVSGMPSEEPSRYSGGGRSMFVLDWSQEREDFFVNMQANMTRLIDLIAGMLFGDTAGNVDKMIAGGGLLALPDGRGAA